MIKKSALILASTALIALTGCEINVNDSDAIQSSGKTITETRTVTAFDSVDNSSPFDVIFSATGEPSVVVEADANIINEVVTSIEGNTLVIRSKRQKNFHFSSRNTPVIIKVNAANLSKFINSGSGDLQMKQLHDDKLSIESNGSGDIYARGTSKELIVKANGSGDLDLRQLSTNSLNIEINGSGDTEIADINAKLEANLNGSGDFNATKINTTQTTISVTGSGDVTLDGSSKNLKVDINGSGNFDGSRLKVENSEIRNTGSGDINLNKMSGNVSIDNFSSGGFEADLDNAGEISIQSDGSGTITLRGSGKKLNAKLNSSGDLEAKSLLLDIATVKVMGSGEARVNVKSTIKVDNNEGSSSNSRVVTIDRNGVVQN
jgi:hypothetical protein